MQGLNSMAGGPAAHMVGGKQITKMGLMKPGHGGGKSWYTQGGMKGGVPRMYYSWMRPGSITRRTFEKKRNPFVDLSGGEYIYFRDVRDPPEAMAAEREAAGVKGSDNALDLYNEYKIVPDLYPEGFQWKHKLNSEYQQWRSNTWFTPDLIPAEHRGRLLCNFYVNVVSFNMRVVKFSPKDHRQYIYCLLYVGSGKGLAGWGRAIAPSTNEAKREATIEAFERLQGVDLEMEGPTYPVRVNYNGVRILMGPSQRVACSVQLADIMCAFGFTRVFVKVNESQKKAASPWNLIPAVFLAVDSLRSLSELAAGRGKIPHALVANIYPYLEELRRKKGMMAMAPKGKDGVFTPDRVVDNRMPDHLKKGYYDDIYWKDFFAGNPAQLNEPRMGMRGDQLRASLLQPVSFQRDRQGYVSPVPINPDTGSSIQGRRTLQSVLSRMGKSSKDLGSIPIFDPRRDAKVASHAKTSFHFH